MRYGLTLPIFDNLADPRLLAELAAEAESHGWDGVFVWDHVYYREPVRAVTDPWTALAAMAVATSKITIGPMVTPLARRRPQVLARQIVALDHLTDGRFVLGAGLGLDSSGGEFVRFGEEADVGRRAEAYDESLDILRAFLSGEQVDHRGTHVTAEGVTFLPDPSRPTCRSGSPVGGRTASRSGVRPDIRVSYSSISRSRTTSPPHVRGCVTTGTTTSTASTWSSSDRRTRTRAPGGCRCDVVARCIRPLFRHTGGCPGRAARRTGSLSGFRSSG